MTPKQSAFLLLNERREGLYGGQAGGGKSVALLAAALQFVEEPNYSALLLRRTFADLSKEKALIPLSKLWLSSTDAKWNERDKKWSFPSGAALEFGYLEIDKHKYKYQSASYNYIGFDELTQFDDSQYTYLFSRLRRDKGSSIPSRMRAATNPGGVGHEWVRNRFNLPQGPPSGSTRFFLPATLEDNPYLDAEEYRESLSELSEVDQAALLFGKWDTVSTGGIWDPKLIQVHGWDRLPRGHEWAEIVRYWDLAATEPSSTNSDPDWTVGLLVGRTRFGRNDITMPDWWVIGIERFRAGPTETERRVAEVTRRDGPGVPIFIEEEKGGAGKALISAYRRYVIPAGYTLLPDPVKGSKEDRAKAAATIIRGNLNIAEQNGVTDFISELGVFPESAHDDQVDALSGGVLAIHSGRVAAAMSSNLRGRNR